ncbi:MAG: DUF2849 domain-containing protein [Pelagimonas sp.]|jgi:hypothetical protein|nr:DUF2849 domain-containing protein [Pelagimonas sp.]
MPKPFTPKVITANALIEGDVIYLTSADQWTRDLREAELLEDEAHAQLRLVEASARQHEAVGIYLADMAPADAGPEPTHFREDFRRTGPSNYAHGKQVELS